jgi:hypothetical protein
VPVTIPALERFIALEQQDLDLRAAWRHAPSALASAMQRRLPALRRVLAAHPQAVDALEHAPR